MADIEVSYENQVIKSLSASGQLVCHTAGKYCDDDITIDYIAPGGGAPVVVANGVFVGAGTNTFSVNIGESAPLKNFYVLIEADDNEFIYDADYKVFRSLATVADDYPLQYYDHQTDYDRYTTPSVPVKVNNGGTITTYQIYPNSEIHSYVRQSTVANHGALFNAILPRYNKYSDHITFVLTTGSNLYKYVNGKDYNWKLVYFGGNYASESISV